MPTRLILLLILGFVSEGYAQIQEISINQGQSKRGNELNGRLKASGPIELPFWDDFSGSNQYVDSAWWEFSSQVQVIAKPGIGIAPPSINVATFDGVNAFGEVYSDTKTDGPVDSLVSRKIDLTKVPANLRNTVFLSFFFQAKGLGEQPEEQDSLLLYMKKADSTWQVVWPLNEPYPTDPTVFTEKFIQVSDPAFYHSEFQFMFRAIGRQNGWFDNWHIDYVYMDKRRALGDNSYLDRTLTQLPTSILGEYSALPVEEYMVRSSSGSILSSTETNIRNLENDFQPIEYSATLTDTLSGVTLETLVDAQPLLLFPKDAQTISAPPPATSAIDPGDTLLLELKYLVNSGDKNLIDSIYNGDSDTVFYDNVNLRVNDTVRTYVSIQDYFAYDDGSAEVGAGINQRDGRLAYEYITETTLFLDKIEAYFPNTDRNQAGSPIEFFVLDDLDETETSTLGIINAAVQHTGIDEFVTYNFTSTVVVTDTFYIGFRHKDVDQLWISLGLDKNTDTGDKIYANVSGVWAQNQSVVGSLMLRPRFTNEVISAISEPLIATKVYPNPSQGRVQFNGSFDHIDAFDLLGKKVPIQITKEGETNIVSFGKIQNQIICLRLSKADQQEVVRVLVHSQ